jgi:hypothetical protein
MRRIIVVATVALILAAMMLAMAMPAFAKSAQSRANCIDNLEKQLARGQTGPETGSRNDEKQRQDAVANCDQVWQIQGSNGP